MKWSTVRVLGRNLKPQTSLSRSSRVRIGRGVDEPGGELELERRQLDPTDGAADAEALAVERPDRRVSGRRASARRGARRFPASRERDARALRAPPRRTAWAGSRRRRRRGREPALGRLAGGGQDHDRARVALLAHLGAELEAVAVGERAVEEQELRQRAFVQRACAPAASVLACGVAMPRRLSAILSATERLASSSTSRAEAKTGSAAAVMSGSFHRS